MVTSLKVLFVSRRYYPDIRGGGEISAHYLARAVKDAGHNVRVLTFVTKSSRIDEVIDGVPITRLPIRTLSFFPRISNLEWMYYEMGRQTKNFLKEFTPDILHALNGESVPSVAFLCTKQHIPLVATVNSPYFFCFVGDGVDRFGQDCFGCRGNQRFGEVMHKWSGKGLVSTIVAFAYWLYSYPHMYLLKKSLDQASVLFPISSGLKTELIKQGYFSSEMFVVHNPINIKKKVHSSLKRDLRIPADASIIVYVGRLSENKGLQRIVGILHRLPYTYFVIVGREVPFQKELLEEAKRVGVVDRVRFVGFVPHENTNPYYSIANVVAMPGTFYESLGRMLMEACTFGVPVIGTSKGGIPDVIENEKNGFLLYTQSEEELFEKVKSILENPRQARSFGKYGKEKMQCEFSAERTAQILIEGYRKAIEKRTVSRS